VLEYMGNRLSRYVTGDAGGPTLALHPYEVGKWWIAYVNGSPRHGSSWERCGLPPMSVCSSPAHDPWHRWSLVTLAADWEAALRAKWNHDRQHVPKFNEMYSSNCHINTLIHTLIALTIHLYSPYRWNQQPINTKHMQTYTHKYTYYLN